VRVGIYIENFGKFHSSEMVSIYGRAIQNDFFSLSTSTFTCIAIGEIESFHTRLQIYV